jgi:uncharacterized protein YjbI with pentapeptide repeats
MPTEDETVLLQGPRHWNEHARRRRAQGPFRPDLRKAVLHGADLQGAELADADFTDAVLTESYLISANLEGADTCARRTSSSPS